MNCVRLFTALGLISLFCAFTIINADEWQVAEGYSIRFSGKRVKGSFSGLKATIIFNENNAAASKISASIDAASISTGIHLKDKHARSGKALNTVQFPLIRFESTQIIKTATGYEAQGKLTIRQTSQDVKLPFTFERTGPSAAVFKGSFSIAPKEYDVRRHGTPETVSIELLVPVTSAR